MIVDIGDLYKRICAVTTAYTFTCPVSLADCSVVWDELAAAVPEGVVSVAPIGDGNLVRVRVSIDGVCLYSRDMIVKGLP